MVLDTLAHWINPQHLSDQAIEQYAERLRTDPHQAVWLDDFLLPQRIAALHGLFSSDGEFEEIYELHDDNKSRQKYKVSKEDWDQAQSNQYFDHALKFKRIRPEAKMNHGSLNYLLFTKLLLSSIGSSYIGRITGQTLSGIEVHPRIMRLGDYLAPHSDYMPTRSICTILYLTEGWQPTFGGRFRQYRQDQPSRNLDPLPNRLTLFHVSTKALHDVEPLSEEAAGWQRRSMTIWFSPAV